MGGRSGREPLGSGETPSCVGLSLSNEQLELALGCGGRGRSGPGPGARRVQLAAPGLLVGFPARSPGGAGAPRSPSRYSLALPQCEQGSSVPGGRDVQPPP